MRLMIARREPIDGGRRSTHPPMGDRLLMITRDGTFPVFSGGGSGHKPENRS